MLEFADLILAAIVAVMTLVLILLSLLLLLLLLVVVVQRLLDYLKWHTHLAVELTLTVLEVNRQHSMTVSLLAIRYVVIVTNYLNHLYGFVAVNIVALNRLHTLALDHLANCCSLA